MKVFQSLSLIIFSLVMLPTYAEPVNCLTVDIDFQSNEVIESLETKRSEPRIWLLNKASLPENASDCEINDYISTIMLLSQNQSSYVASHPQVMLLTRAVKDKINLIIPYGKNHYGPVMYIDGVLKNLASEDNRDLIIEAFKQYDYLIDVIAHKKWGKHAEQILIEKSAEYAYQVNYDYVEALVGIQDEKHNELLKKILLTPTNNRHIALMRVKTQPNFDYDVVLNEIWNNQSLNELESQYTVMDALNIGNKIALQWLIQNPDKSIYNSSCKTGFECATNVLLSSLDKDELKEWYKDNREYLLFSEEDKTFKMDESFSMLMNKAKKKIFNLFN